MASEDNQAFESDLKRKKSKKNKQEKLTDDGLIDEKFEENVEDCEPKVKKSKKHKKEKDLIDNEISNEKNVETIEYSEGRKKKSKKHKKEKESNEQEIEEHKESIVETNECNENSKTNHKKEEKGKEDSLGNEKQEDKLVIHSANNWEQADFGDDSRKLKFLKLMGAAKHQDAEDPSKKHFRSKTETEKINQDLEKQFVEGITAKVHHRDKGHIGLGFDDNSTKSNNTSANASSKFDKSKFKMSFVKAND